MSKVYMTAELSQNFAVATVANESSIEDKSAAKRVQLLHIIVVVQQLCAI